MVHDSDSSTQLQVEALILSKVAEHLGVALVAQSLALAGGARVQVDGADVDRRVLVEAFARQGAMKGGQRRKVAQDALKLITLKLTHPEARLILAFADSAAAAYATQGTWLAEALATWDIEVLVVELDDETREGIKAAQVRQVMVNPAAPQAPGATE